VSELPSGWVMATLNEVLEPQAKGRLLEQGWSPQCLKESSEDSTVWGVLKTTAIQPGTFLAEHNKRLPDHLDPRPGIEVQVGDLLLTCAGPRSRCGIPTLVRNTRPRLMISGKMYRFRAKASVMEPIFLEKYLLSPLVQRAIDDMKTGVSDSGLNLTHERFLRLEVPVPPLDEQRRIVAILEDHLSRLDAARSGLGGVLTRLGNYRLALHESALSGEVGDRPFDSRGWPRMTLDDLQAEGPAAITDGPFGSNLKSSHYTAGGARVIRLQNIGLGDFLDAQAHISLEHFESLRRHEAMEGDLIVASLGDVLPRVCILPDLGEPAIVKADCIRVRLGGSVRPRWVLMAMLTPQARRWAKEQLHGVGRMRLGLKAIREFSLPVPDVATQDAILIAVDDLLLRARNVEASARKTLLLNDALRRSLLAAAFSGQLTKESVSV
jgi:type I restriction enzyme S subunit